MAVQKLDEKQAADAVLNKDDKHSWKSIKSEDKYVKAYVCTRGDCRCTKRVTREGVLYERSKIFYNERPNCFGDVPISEQNDINL